jgi:thiol:disulfide interchange protein DsbA
MTEWLGRNGVDSKKFFDTMKSFGVQSKTRRAAQLSVAYKIDGTPAMAVQGRYTVSADQGGSREGMLDTVSYLVNMVRQGK